MCISPSGHKELDTTGQLSNNLFCHEHWGVCIFKSYSFLQLYAQEWGCRIMWELYFCFFLKETPYCFIDPYVFLCQDYAVLISLERLRAEEKRVTEDVMVG